MKMGLNALMEYFLEGIALLRHFFCEEVPLWNLYKTSVFVLSAYSKVNDLFGF